VTIPKIIHQTAPQKHTLDTCLQSNILALQSLNPRWEYRFYDDRDIKNFIKKHFGQDMQRCFSMINPIYGAAKADFFRYLAMYIYGGVYLDIKSKLNQSLDDVLLNNDNYILSHWRNKIGQEHEGWGLYSDLDIFGEYQQWHIIAAPTHAFLELVIKNVQSNIENYNIKKDGTGKLGVLKLTGPIAYTKAIKSIENDHSYRKVDIQDLGFQYTIVYNHENILKFGPTHYSKLTDPIVISQQYYKID